MRNSLIRYTASRALVPGVASGTVVELPVGIRTLIPRVRIFGVKNTSLSGNEESVLNRVERIWSLSTGYELDATVDEWTMFVSSVAGSESFTLDRLPTDATKELTVFLVSTSIAMTPLARGAFRIGFDVREVVA